MATAEELLTSTAESTDEILVVDLNTRVISIPASLKVLGVESDDDVKRLQFRMPQYYGEFDLSTFDIRVNFKDERGNGDFYPVDGLTVTGDNLINFSWLVNRTAFNYAGDVKFSLCMKLYDSNGVVVKELNTTFASLPVLEGLETEKAVVNNNPSAFDTVLYRLYAVEAATGNGQNGYYNVVKVATSDDGVLFTIVDQLGETVAYVRHGKDGEDGYTPVKGVDYWSDEDKEEIKQEAYEYVESWAPIYTTVTLASSGWVDNSQTVTVEGVTKTCIVFVCPDPTDTSYINYALHTVRCTAQDTSSLTFTCESTPSNNINVNVAIYNSSVDVSGGV